MKGKTYRTFRTSQLDQLLLLDQQNHYYNKPLLLDKLQPATSTSAYCALAATPVSNATGGTIKIRSVLAITRRLYINMVESSIPSWYGLPGNITI